MIVKIHKKGDWNSFCDFFKENGASNLWQSPQWFQFMIATRRNPELFVLLENNRILASFQISTRFLPIGFSYSYLGRGPVVLKEIQGTEREQELYHEILCFLKARPIQYTLLDPLASPYKIKELEELIPQTRGIIPNHTRVIDLTIKEEIILSRMSPKGKYNVRLAEKRGVIVRQSDNLAEFYEIMRESNKKHKIPLLPKHVFEKMLRLLDARLFFAEKQGILHAAALLVIFKHRAIYYYGASRKQYARDMASYLLQWTMIKNAKQAGCKIYDLHGICPPNQDSHYLKKVSIFKKRFGGRIESHAKHCILVSRPVRHFLFSLLKKIRLPFNR